MSIMDNPLPTSGGTDTWVKVAIGALALAAGGLYLRQKAHEEFAYAAFDRFDALADRLEALLPQPDPDPAETVEPVELEPEQPEQPEATAKADAEPLPEDPGEPEKPEAKEPVLTMVMGEEPAVFTRADALELTERLNALPA